MSDIRHEYGHEDPWGEFEEGEQFGCDALYEGDHELIENLILLTEVHLDFEAWAEDFRYWDELAHRSGGLSDWEETSYFSELMSIKMSKREVEL